MINQLTVVRVQKNLSSAAHILYDLRYDSYPCHSGAAQCG